MGLAQVFSFFGALVRLFMYARANTSILGAVIFGNGTKVVLFENVQYYFPISVLFSILDLHA